MGQGEGGAADGAEGRAAMPSGAAEPGAGGLAARGGPSAARPAAARVQVDVASLAVGGDAVGRLPEGRAVFVTGALPGETVEVEVTELRPRFARAVTLSVVSASPDRVAPPCPWVAHGCGGCGLQHARHDAQRRYKGDLVRDALARIGRIDAPAVVDGPELGVVGFRTTVRAAVAGPDGRMGFRRARGHDVVCVGSCLVAHPLVEEVLIDGRFPRAREVTVRAAAASGERLVVVDGPLDEVRVPADVAVISAASLRAQVPAPGPPARGRPGLPVGRSARAAARSAQGRTQPEAAPVRAAAGPVGRPGAQEVPAVHEIVAGRRWRVSAGSFFQTRPDGAEALVHTVAAELAAAGFADGVLVDAYCGVGLFAAAAPRARSIIGIESNPFAVADAIANAESHAAPRTDREPGSDGGRPPWTVVRSAVERWAAVSADAVVADPARRGLGSGGVAALVATGAPVIVLVSCDAGSLGRDAGLLAARGYRLRRGVVVDLFPHTAHVEVVSRFER